MVGGRTGRPCKRCEPIFKTLAPPDGYAHVGPPGAGHYVKMIHNGIEYGMLQAYAEGYEILHASKDFRARPAPDRRAVEPRQRRALVAQRAGRARVREGPDARRRSRATSRTPAKDAGRCRRRSTWTCRRR